MNTVYIIFLSILYFFNIIKKSNEIIHDKLVNNTYKSKNNYENVIFLIYRCINHNISIKDKYCYVILCERSSRSHNLSIKFKELYFLHFKTIPVCVAIYSNYPFNSDIDSLFYYFYKEIYNYDSYIFCKNGLLYLKNMEENEFLIKFKFLYQDSKNVLIDRKK
jgi:hypothetical protein